MLLRGERNGFGQELREAGAAQGSDGSTSEKKML